jgi:uncharacterized membrane protein
MGHFGNLNDKVRFLKTTSTIHSRGIATTILIQEIGCLSGLLYITMDEFFFISISASILGFCHSSMQQSIISYTIQRYTDVSFLPNPFLYLSNSSPLTSSTVSTHLDSPPRLSFSWQSTSQNSTQAFSSSN